MGRDRALALLREAALELVPPGDRGEPLRLCRALDEVAELARAECRSEVGELVRVRHVGWGAVAAAFGVSRSAVSKRFGG